MILALTIAVPQQTQISPPTLIQKVEPNYDASMANYPLDPIFIRLTIDEYGVPASVDSHSGIPASVVRAIAKSRYSPATQNGKPVSVSIPLTLQVRRPYSYFGRIADRPYTGEWEGAGSLKWEGAGWNLKDQSSVTAIEKSLSDNAGSEESRAVLAAYASTTELEAARQLQARQIAWLVQKLPSSRILGRPAAMLFPSVGVFQNKEGYEQVREIWMEQLARNPNDPATVAHASYFFRLTEPEYAEKLLIASIPQVPGASTWLGELYALGAAGVTRVDYKNGLPSATGTALPSDGFGKHAQTELGSGSDPRVLVSAIAVITEGGRMLARHQSLPSGYRELCEALLKRVKVIDPGSDESCELTPESPGTVRAGALTKNPSPKYPSEARQLGAEGVLKFTDTIGKDGKLKDIELVSGPLVFFEPAMDAVTRWEYKPTLLNGMPVEVISSITINFKQPGK